MSHLSLKCSLPRCAFLLAVAAGVAPLRMTGAQVAYASPSLAPALGRRPSSTVGRESGCAGNLAAAKQAIGWDSDIADAIDDSTYAAVLTPGSGMVAVDSLGRLITSGDPAPDHAAVATVCCTDVEPPSVPKPAVDLPANYTASKGRALARCADSMKPPPSSLSPL